MSDADEKLQARGGDMVDDTDAFLAWLDSLPKEPNDKLKAMYAAYKATVKTAPDLAELVGLLGRANEELRMLRAKDTGAVYDVMLRLDLAAALAKIKEPQT